MANSGANCAAVTSPASTPRNTSTGCGNWPDAATSGSVCVGRSRIFRRDFTHGAVRRAAQV